MRPMVAVTSRLYIATAFSDVAMTLDEERVLPPQLQKPVFLDWLFSCTQCSHMRPTVAVTSRLYIATAFSDYTQTTNTIC